MRIRVIGGVADLRDALVEIKAQTRPRMRGVVRDGIRVGNDLAKDYARVSSRKHARKYPGTFTAAMNRGGGLFGNVISGEYGPQPRGQGLLAPILENGSRNNPAHLNLARSADVIAPSFLRSVDDEMGDIFKEAGF